MDQGEGSAASVWRVRQIAGLVRVASAVVAAIALGAVIVSSIVLLSRYRPDPRAAWNLTVGAAPSPQSWVTLHQTALDVAGVAALMWFVTTAWLARARTRAATAVAVTAAAIALVCTWVAARTWPLVRWDQVGLWAVTVGTNFAGLWKPAMSDQVRFVLIHGSEVSPQTYLAALLIHLAAPVLALLCIGVSALAARHRPRPEGPPIPNDDPDDFAWEPLVPG
jgi:quinol-cytochrome oxidoreductase complex cytochrome b subunit